jgi:hypothetical protein
MGGMLYFLVSIIRDGNGVSAGGEHVRLQFENALGTQADLLSSSLPFTPRPGSE